MAKRVNLDAMIPRADFGDLGDGTIQERIESFRLADLADDSPILKSLRKPDFQRETNHWTPDQVATLIQSFVDDELVPSLILWDSETYMFVIDGGHRLSALRAWIADDYGDQLITHKFYNGHISRDQRNVAKMTRTLVESRVGKFSDLRQLAAETSAPDPIKLRRGNRMFRRPLDLQWVRGNKEVAQSSFFKINSQGTPLDPVETSLIRNRRKPIAIAARSVIRAGEGHKYGTDFTPEYQRQVSETSAELYKVLFEPEVDSPIRTLDIPLGGSVSPVDALALLIEFLTITGRASPPMKLIHEYDDDLTGELTSSVLRRTLSVVRRMTTNSSGSLGLHPAVYYYSDKGKQ